MNATHQGFPALALALLYGHNEIALKLVEKGANPNSRDFMESSIIETLCCANHISDEECVEIAANLQRKGLSVSEISQQEAIRIASSRKKTKLVAFLESC